MAFSVAIPRWMRIARDDAHAETILGKIYTETDNKAAALSWLQRAELIAEQAGGKINLADIKMVLGFYYRKFTREKLVKTLASAICEGGGIVAHMQFGHDKPPQIRKAVSAVL
jgi:hypothetical protein